MSETTDRYYPAGYVVFDRRAPAGRPVASVPSSQHGLYHTAIIAEALSRHARERPDLYATDRPHLGGASGVDAVTAENASLKKLVWRLTESLSICVQELPDPGTEALAAIHCGRHLIYG